MHAYAKDNAACDMTCDMRIHQTETHTPIIMKTSHDGTSNAPKMIGTD